MKGYTHKTNKIWHRNFDSEDQNTTEANKTLDNIGCFRLENNYMVEE